MNVLPLPNWLSSEISPPEQLAQFFDDRQAQARARILAGHRVAAGQDRLTLAELFENQRLDLLRQCRRPCRPP